jgi:tetratricopeptide (TPR) repeat protein
MTNSLCGEKDTPAELAACSKEVLFDIYDNPAKYDAIAKKMESLKSTYAKYPEYHALKSLLCEYAGDEIEAIASITESIALNPRNAAYYHRRASIHFQQEAFWEARDDYETIIEKKELLHRDYFLSEVQQMMLLLCCSIGDWEMAEELLETNEDDYEYYAKPVNGMITRERIAQAILQRNRNWYKENG